MTEDIHTRNIERTRDEEKSEVEYDELLSAAGQLGRYQWILFFTTCPFYAFGVLSYFSQIFLTQLPPNYWCKIPELENLTDFQRRDIGVPKDPYSRLGYSQCMMYAVNWTEVLSTGQKPNDNWTTIPCKYGWEFNKSEIPYPTISSDFEWVCEKSSYQAIAQSIFFIGSVFGGLLFGWIGDRYGRLLAIICSCLVGGVGSILSTFTRNLTEFAAARFVMGMSHDTCLIIAYLVLLEYIAPEYRTLMANMSYAVFYAIFLSIIPWIALACGHWRIMTLVTGLPFLLAVLTKLILPESPRWLLSQGRIDEAIEKIHVISRYNKTKVPVKMIDQFKLSVSNSQKEQQCNWLEIMKRPVIRKLYILTCLEYMCCAIVFDGLVRSIGQLDSNFFTSFSIISLTEFPSNVIVAFTMDYVGRRGMAIICLSLCCIFCFLTAFSSGILNLIFAVLARFVVNMAYNAAIQWTPELLPVSVRVSGMAIVHICGFAAEFFSSYIAYLKDYIYWLPLTVIGAIAGIGTCIAFVLPETAKKRLPQTFEDAENLTKDHQIWSLPFLDARKRKKRPVAQINEGFELET